MNKVMNKMIFLSTIIIFTIIFICSLFMQSNVFYNQNHIISLLITIPIFLIFLSLLKLRTNEKIKNISLKNTVIFLFIYFIIVSIIQFVVLKFLSVDPGWDFGVIFDNSVKFVNEGSILNSLYPDYLQYYPNNIMLFIFEVLFIKIGNIFSIKPIISCYIMNIVFIDFALLLLFLVLRKKYNNVTAIIGMILTLFFIPLFLYTPIFYSDTLSLFIPLSILLLYLYIDDSNVRKNNIIFIVLGFVLFIGWQIKISSIFILIAILFDYIINHKKVVLNLVLMVSVFIILTLTFKILIVNNKKFEFKQNEYGSYPFTHWIMMGVENIDRDNSGRNSYGGYSGEDYDLSRKFSTGKDAISFNIKEYFNRVNKMGIIVYGEYLIRKNVNIWSDGYYFSDIKLNVKQKNKYNFIRNFMFNNKETKYFMINFTQAVQYVFILILIFGSILKLKNKDIKIDYLRLTVLGLLLFFSFWEARSRYIFNYIPIFVIIIIEGVMILNERKIIKKI